MQALQQTLFPDDGENTYAIVDGASCEDLLDRLDEFKPAYFCLYAGELEPDVQEVAPYLVALLPDHPFTSWLLENGLDKPWCIFARSGGDLQAMRKHFRTFLLVKSPEGKTIYFRYYDPRVLRLYLPTCNPGELRYIFGPVSSYLAADNAAALAIRWDYADGTLTSTQVALDD